MSICGDFEPGSVLPASGFAKSVFVLCIDRIAVVVGAAMLRVATLA